VVHNTYVQGGGDEYVVALHSVDGGGSGGGRRRHHNRHATEPGGGGGGSGMTAPLAFALFVASCSQFLVGYVWYIVLVCFTLHVEFQPKRERERGRILRKKTTLLTDLYFFPHFLLRNKCTHTHASHRPSHHIAYIFHHHHSSS
jgi:hypothetical protein